MAESADGGAPQRSAGGWVLWILYRALRFLLLLVVAMVLVLPFVVVLSNTLRPRMPTRSTPEREGLTRFDAVSFVTADGLTLQAWWIPAKLQSDRTMLVCHGVGANRDDSLRFVPFLHDGGYNVLMFDWRGHGLSDWARVTFGLNEKQDVRAAIQWAQKNHPDEMKWLGALGISMGAGILVQAGTVSPEIQAFVLDSPFASVRTMLPYMLRTLPEWLRSLAVASTVVAARICVGASVDEIAPLSVIASLAPRPIFMSHGTADKVIPHTETESLFAAAKEPKEKWIEEGIGHTELREYRTEEYHRRVLAFLEKARVAKK